MKTIRRLLYGELLLSVLLVTLGFLSLFYFFDFVDELKSVSQYAATGYTVVQALLYVALMLPSHLYELLPITVLIGTIFVMSRLAQSSEFTILRTSGLGPWLALRILLILGLFFVVLTFAVGDYIAPLSDKTAQLLKSRYQGKVTVGKTGAWLKERQNNNNAMNSHFTVNVDSLTPDAGMRNVRILEFDEQGLLVSMTKSQSARFENNASWLLENVDRTEFKSPIERRILPQYHWPTQINAEMVATAVLQPDRMGTDRKSVV